MTAEQLLERGMNLAGNGLLNPLAILADLALVHCGPDHFKKVAGELAPHSCGLAGDGYGVAYHALVRAAGSTLSRWYGLGGRRTAEVVCLFQDALFDVQLGG